MPHRMLDPRSGLVFDTHDLTRRAGTMRRLTRVADAPEGIAIDVIGVPPGSPVDLDLAFESVVEGVLVTGTAEVRLRGECVRCLDEVTDTAVIEVQELFCYPDKELDDPEASRIEGELIDLEPVLRDAVVLDLPFTPVCRPDCLGLCPACGASLNDDPGHAHGEAADPRWSDLVAWTDRQPIDGLTGPTSKE